MTGLSVEDLTDLEDNEDTETAMSSRGDEPSGLVEQACKGRTNVKYGERKLS